MQLSGYFLTIAEDLQNMSEDLTPLWNRADEHGKAISELQIGHAVHKEMLASHTAQIAQISRESSERHGQLVTMVGALGTKQDAIIAEHNQNKGADRFKLWLVPIMLTIIGIGIALEVVG